MLGVMYTINNDASGVILVRIHCPQASTSSMTDSGAVARRLPRAMLKHVRNDNGNESIGNPKPQIMERWY